MGEGIGVGVGVVTDEGTGFAAAGVVWCPQAVVTDAASTASSTSVAGLGIN
ncbi:hypothetical protein OG555_19480 [Kribbella sp. NBC_01484]|uniref:hypothetical protein n=1 Tax=Kribbella sp. NBC_01484 TaxID=2903579 RepID=UPI002E30D311|nr:hypothetical protein [Kribbella sp. NBC_01484]